MAVNIAVGESTSRKESLALQQTLKLIYTKFDCNFSEKPGPHLVLLEKQPSHPTTSDFSCLQLQARIVPPHERLSEHLIVALALSGCDLSQNVR